MAQFTTIPILKRVGGEWSVEINWVILVLGTMLLAITTYHLVEVVAYSKTRDVARKASRRLAKVVSERPIAEQSGEPESPITRDLKS
jgi:peptidoglycan/LPS O-acetylase OafA/YrhL